MAWASKKQYAILMNSEEGKDLAEKIGDMEQGEFNKAFSELIGKKGNGSYSKEDEEKDFWEYFSEYSKEGKAPNSNKQSNDEKDFLGDYMNEKSKEKWLEENGYDSDEEVPWWEKDDNAEEYSDEEYKDLKGQMYFQNEQGWTNNGKTLPNLTDEQLKERLEKASGGGKFKNVMIESYKGDNIVDIAMEDSDGQLVYGTYDRNTGFTKLEPQGINAKKSGGTYGEFRKQNSSEINEDDISLFEKDREPKYESEEEEMFNSVEDFVNLELQNIMSGGETLSSPRISEKVMDYLIDELEFDEDFVYNNEKLIQETVAKTIEKSDYNKFAKKKETKKKFIPTEKTIWDDTNHPLYGIAPFEQNKEYLNDAISEMERHLRNWPIYTARNKKSISPEGKRYLTNKLSRYKKAIDYINNYK